jgi:hypothetical protein
MKTNATIISALVLFGLLQGGRAEVVRISLESPLDVVLPMVKEHRSQVVVFYGNGRCVLFVEKGHKAIGEIRVNNQIKITEFREYAGDEKTILKMKGFLSSQAKWWVVNSAGKVDQANIFELPPSQPSKSKTHTSFFSEKPQKLEGAAGEYSIEELQYFLGPKE